MRYLLPQRYRTPKGGTTTYLALGGEGLELARLVLAATDTVDVSLYLVPSEAVLGRGEALYDTVISLDGVPGMPQYVCFAEPKIEDSRQVLLCTTLLYKGQAQQIDLGGYLVLPDTFVVFSAIAEDRVFLYTNLWFNVSPSSASTSEENVLLPA